MNFPHMKIRQIMVSARKYSDIFFNPKRLSVKHPANVQLSLNKTCNLHCTFCARQTKLIRDQLVNEKSLVMSCEFLKKNSGLFKNADYVNLAADGEPLYHPEIKEILRTISAVSQKPNIIFVTNGVLLNDELIRLIVESQVMEVHFSIDSLQEENLRFLRPGVDLDQITTSIEKINLEKKKNNSEFPFLVLRPALISRTIEELPSMVEFCHRYGLRTVLIQQMQIYKEELAKYSIAHYKDSVKQNINIAHQRACELGVGFVLDTAMNDIENLSIGNLQNSLRKMEKNTIALKDMKVNNLREKCNLPWEFMLVQTNGDVYPCCHSRYFLGNLNDELWENVWNGPRAKGLRRKFINDILPKECVNQPCGIGKAE